MTKRTQRLITALLSSVLIALLSWGRGIDQNPSDPTQPTPQAPNTSTTSAAEIDIKATEITPANTSPIAKKISVARVIDGDTFVLNTGEHVRLIGIDTPELHPRDGTGIQCYAGEAAQRLVELTFQKEVRLEKDKSETDRYKRLLRYAYVNDVFVNKVLVTEGYAKARAYKPDTSKHLELETAMNEAQKSGKGMWKECEQIEPKVK
jgi:micrococcal nuclease